LGIEHLEESFLAEQLERMRRLTERMSQAHNRVVENCESIARDRDQLHSPLSDVRDLRPLQTHDYSESPKRRRRR
jgi:hypothetical protein